MVEKIISKIFIYLCIQSVSSLRFISAVAKYHKTKTKNIYRNCQNIFSSKLFSDHLHETTFLSIVPKLSSTPSLPQRNFLSPVPLLFFPLFCCYPFTSYSPLPFLFLMPISLSLPYTSFRFFQSSVDCAKQVSASVQTLSKHLPSSV